MSDYVDVCAAADVSSGRHRPFVVGGRSILIFKIDGEYFAIDNRCTHLDHRLDDGRQIGCQIICRAHGGRFDIRTGKAVGSPAVEPVARYDTRVRDGRIEIRLPS